MNTFFRKKRAWIAAVSLLAVSAVFVSAQKSDFRIGKDLEILFNLFREVSMNYVDPTDPDELMRNAADGMLGDLDPYTEFYTEDDMAGVEMMTTGKYGGIGAIIRKKGDWVEIAQLYRGFAADKAGLKIGDRILAIDGESMRGAEVEAASGRLKGDPGTTLRLTVERYRDGTTQELTLRRERIAISGVSYYGMVNDSVGVIVHDDFTEDCSTDIHNALNELKASGMSALILDYRNNSGGIMQEAVKVVGLFVPQGSEVVTTRGRNPASTVSQSTPSNPVDTTMPIAVLIGRNSASAAEIVAGALQDLDRAVLVGQRSFGKGLVQTIRPVGYNAYVKVTTAKYYIPSGRCIQAIDYSRRNADGAVEFVPDSLIREFRTRNGRKVYDGGGVMPDVLTRAPNYSLFTLNLYARSYIEDFAMEYIRRSGFAPVDPRSFTLSDEAYADFIAFMADKPVDYESETKVALEALVRKANEEQYGEAIAGELDAIRRKITKDKQEELVRLRPEIARLIEDDIVLYDNYLQGIVQHKLRSDETLSQAAAVLADRPEYRRILTEQDTRRNEPQ
jgi:carboxyl-terminal processing protease